MACERCGHPTLILMGRLGRLVWLRCQACGWDTDELIEDNPELYEEA